MQVAWYIEAETPVEHVHMCTRATFADTMCQKISVLQYILNEVCSGSQEGKFWGWARSQKNFSYCSLLLQTGTITATVSVSHHYSNDLFQSGLEYHLLHSFVYGHSTY